MQDRGFKISCDVTRVGSTSMKKLKCSIKNDRARKEALGKAICRFVVRAFGDFTFAGFYLMRDDKSAGCSIPMETVEKELVRKILLNFYSRSKFNKTSPPQK